jgi:hypothetical protein
MALGFLPIDTALIGAVDGVAALDGTGKVPGTQLPAIVSADVIAALGYTPVDPSSLAPSATVDTTNADNITAGHLAVSQLPLSGVTPGTYTNATVVIDAQGRVVDASVGSVGAGSLFTFASSAGIGNDNDTNEKVLVSYTISPGVMVNANDTLRITAFGTMSGDPDVTFKLSIDGAWLAFNNSGTASAENWFNQWTIALTGTGEYVISGFGSYAQATGFLNASTNSNPTQVVGDFNYADFSSPVLVQLSATAASAQANAGVVRYFKVEKL